MKYLFICSAGEHRAPEAARVAREIAEKKGLTDFVADYLGMSRLAKSEIKQSVSQYDKVFVMEKWMRNRIWKATSQKVNPVVLNIQDDYTGPNKTHLTRTLESKLQRYL